jgi:Uma2 family endonuclease
MQVDVEKRLFTVEEYSRMAEAGILAEDDRVELINGEIIQMSPVGSKHAECLTLHSSDSMTPLAFPDFALPIETLLG